MSVLEKVALLAIFETGFSLAKLNVTRWIIKAAFTGGELPLDTWFSWAFLTSLTWQQILGLLGIASMTLITFPLGVWLGSFKLGVSYPVQSIVKVFVTSAMFPLNIFVMHSLLQEFVINRMAVIGIGLVEAGSVLRAIAWWIIIQSQKGLMEIQI